jgi:tRNA dimethylallyltransferase
MRKVLLLMGPTGVGKTSLSILMAQALDTEIISADSMQIYRHMDIGTAKPSLIQRRAVRHHIIDIVEPTESFSTGRYISMVGTVIEGLHKRGRTPLIVGGTGLYMKAMTRGLFRGPSADWRLREELLSEEHEQSGRLYARLLEADAKAAGRISPNDTRRIVRALEVYLKGRMSISEMQQRFTEPLPYEFVKLVLTRQRKELYRIIDERVDAMVSAGLVDEVTHLLSLHPDRTPLQAIGYKEIGEHLSGQIPLDEAIALIKKRSRRYAKRQLTWFRQEEGARWIDVTGMAEAAEMLAKVSEETDLSFEPGVL